VDKTNKATVFVHICTLGTMNNPQATKHDFARVPTVGEYFGLKTFGPWYRVTGVVHTPFEDAEWEAEIYAVEVERGSKRDGIDDFGPPNEWALR
jgi:hypothetical protein